MADVESIFKVVFKNYIATLRETSYDDNNKEYLCSDKSQKVYNFDLIVKSMYPKKQPASYDALLVQDKNVYCVEFKNEKYSTIDKEQLKKKLNNNPRGKAHLLNASLVLLQNLTISHHKRGILTE